MSRSAGVRDGMRAAKKSLRAEGEDADAGTKVVPSEVLKPVISGGGEGREGEVQVRMGRVGMMPFSPASIEGWKGHCTEGAHSVQTSSEACSSSTRGRERMDGRILSAGRWDSEAWERNWANWASWRGCVAVSTERAVGAPDSRIARVKSLREAGERT